MDRREFFTVALATVGSMQDKQCLAREKLTDLVVDLESRVSDSVRFIEESLNAQILSTKAFAKKLAFECDRQAKQLGTLEKRQALLFVWLCVLTLVIGVDLMTPLYMLTV